ncbi:hypothetical protein L6Q96_10040 [Candidatus Binatia bacterium]|nr:hypothetical protein [Candidatus Binatia bacterium]
MRTAMDEKMWWLAVAVLLTGMPAAAQTPTPTPGLPTATPTPTCTARAVPELCAGAKKLLVTWTAKDPGAIRLAVSATNCPAIPACGLAGDGELVSEPPVAVTVSDAAGLVLARTLTAPGVNAGGCPGGHDTYRDKDRLRFVFGEGGRATVIGKVRIPQAGTTAPVVTPPLSVTIGDACGTLFRTSVGTCSWRVSSSRTDVKCY